MVEGANRNARKRLEPGTVLNNNYRILEQIGEGGMGSVYRAANIFMEEDHVAVKVIRAEQADDDVFRQMFGKEVKAMLRLNNPRLVAYRTFAHDPELDLSFIVTEFIDGPALKSLIGKRQFTPQELLSLMSELAIGLRAAHKAGIVHRDMAPDNVLLEDGDFNRPKIIDFGIVKDTAGDGTTIIGTGFAGKYNFVAPEQLGEPDYAIGPWTDIYSLALVILGLANGKTIDMGNTPGAAIRTRRDVPDLTPIAEPMRPLLAAMLANHPDDRIRSAEEVLDRVGPIFAELDLWEAQAEDLDPTVIAPSAGGAAVPLMGENLSASAPEDEEVTQVVTETSQLEAGAAEDVGVQQHEPYEEQYGEYDEEPSGGSGKLAWIALGLIAAAALAAFGGMMAGEFAGLSRGEVKAINGEERPTPSASTTDPEPTPTETEPTPAPTPTGPPEVNIATSLAPDSGVRPIGMSEWLRQDDLPRELFRGESVRGIIAAYLTVMPDGSVTRCTIGRSSEVEPERFLRPAAVGVCRALRERARFEPYTVEPSPSPSPTPVPTATATFIPPAVEAVQAQAIEFSARQDRIQQPRPAGREVFVRVAFRTADPPAPEMGSAAE